MVKVHGEGHMKKYFGTDGKVSSQEIHMIYESPTYYGIKVMTQVKSSCDGQTDRQTRNKARTINRPRIKESI